MAKQIIKLLDAVAANATGTAKYIGVPCGIIFTTTGTVSMTVTILCSNDGTNFGTLATLALTTATSTPYYDEFGWPYLRIDVSSYSNGTVTATVSY